MKHLLQTTFLLSAFCYLSSFTTFAQKPTLDIIASKRVITLDDEKLEETNQTGKKVDPNKVKEAQEARTKVSLKSNFVKNGVQQRSLEWAVTGVQGQDWEITKGDFTKGEVELNFKRVGNYSVSLSVTYVDPNQKLKKGQEEPDELDLSVDYDNYITVTNNLDELTQLHADSNFIKLVKRAGDYSIKEKYANDPTPYIFLAKGLYGVYRKQLKDPMIQDPFEEALTACATAIERDANGVFEMPIHKMWLNGIQQELLNNGVRFILDSQDDYPILYNNQDKEKTAETLGSMLEACDSYSTISKNPVAIKFVEAAIRYNNKDAKTANLIWKTEVPNLLNIKDKDFDNWTQSDKDALRTGLILSSQALLAQAEAKKDTSAATARKIMQKAEKWFEYDKEWIAYYEVKLKRFEGQ
ncbi:MAG: hypothetical protein ACKOBN_09050 [Flavobacteriales bacterium]